MQVEKCGNNLTASLPAAAVEDTGLQEGNKIEIASERRLRIDCGRPRDNALARLHALNWILPSGFRFSRDEARGNVWRLFIERMPMTSERLIKGYRDGTLESDSRDVHTLATVGGPTRED